MAKLRFRYCKYCEDMYLLEHFGTDTTKSSPICREEKKDARASLGDSYVKDEIKGAVCGTQRMQGIKMIIPDELVALKRKAILLTREIRRKRRTCR